MGDMVLNLGLSVDTHVFVDRRHGERRSERRLESSDRRQSSIDAALHEHGFAVVELPVRAG